MGMSLIFMFVIAVVLVLYVLAYWMIFRKAGEAGWKALIPFYGTYIEYKLFWNNRMFVLWLIMALIAASLRFVSGPGAMAAQDVLFLWTWGRVCAGAYFPYPHIPVNSGL